MMKKCFLMLIALVWMAVPALAYNADAVVDGADLLSSAQETTLENALDDIYDAYDFQIVLHTVDGTDYRDLAMYAADFYDENGYGYGGGYDGLIFVVDMGAREYATVTTGSGMSLFSDYDIARMEDGAVGGLSSGDYARAFQTYLAYAEDHLQSGGSAYYYDDYGFDGMEYMGDAYRVLYDSPVSYANHIFPGILIAAVVITGIVLGVMISGMKTARKKNQAQEYMTRVNMTRQADIFLYSTQTRRKIQTDNHGSHSGGGSSFRGSSGRSHGGGRVGRF